MKKKKFLLALFLFAMIVQPIFAQQRTISGVVSDEAGPLVGATVNIKGTTTASETDLDGKYSIKAKTGDILVFRFIGMITQEITVGIPNTINVTLKSDNILEEVVVVAYGTAKKSAFTGSATQINSADIIKRPITNIVNVLDGASPGVRLTPANGQPGSSPSIRVRGFGSINASNSPLFIVDGVQFIGSFSSLNPNDIESVSVLKDAASTSLYGSRAANGVVIITTKKGRKGKGTFNIDISQGVNSRSIPEYDRVSASQYYPLMWEALRNGFSMSGSTPVATANQMATNQIFTQLGVNPFNVPNNQIVLNDGTLNPAAQLLYPEDLDWQEHLIRSGIRSNLNFSYSGATEKSDYYLSLGYLKDEGYIIRSDFERITARLNMNTKLNDWFKTGLNLSSTVSTSNNANDGGSSSLVNPFRTTRYIAPIYPVYLHNPQTGAYILDSNGFRQYDFGVARVGSSSGRHVIQETLLNVDRDNITSISARTYAEFTFLKDFTFTMNASLDKRFIYVEEYDNRIVGDGAPDGRASRDNFINSTVNYNQLLRYSKDFGKHSVGALLGHESFETQRNFLTASRTEQIVDGNTELINFTTTTDADSNRRRLTREGYFSNFTYDYDDTYYLTASYRRDGSSRFSKDARWGNFFSVGGAWRLDKESFMERFEWLNTFKIRGSYGEVGNDILGGFYASQALFSLGFNNGADPGILTSEAGNRDLTWETNVQSDIAAEFSLFDNRLSGSIEYYNRKSKDLLFNVPLPVSGGLDDFPDNIGSMVNKGVEIDLTYKIINNDDLNWTFNLNAATVSNEITEMPQDEIINGTKKLVVGGDIYAYWLRDWHSVDPADGAGLFTLDPDLGALGDADVRTAADGSLVTTNQNKALFHFAGTAIPDLFGAFSNTIRYKGFELGFTFTYQIGGKTYDGNYASLMESGEYGVALSTDILNRWQNPGDITDVPRLDAVQAPVFGAGSDRWLVNSDFLALRQMNFSYSFSNAINKKLGISQSRVYVTGENLFVINARRGMEASQNFSGTTSNRFTPARVITLGLNLTF